MGAIQNAVLQVLQAAHAPLRTGEIHSRVEARLERAVSRDTIKGFLSVAARDPASAASRTARGRYACTESSRETADMRL
jgi:hypothetical protein